MKTIHDLLAEHPFFNDLAPSYFELIVGCGSNKVYKTDSYVFREGDNADRFFVIRRGRVRLQITHSSRGSITIATIGPGEVFSWSWLFPPYQWYFDARVIEEVHAVVLDGVCLREKIETDSKLGYELMRRFAQIIRKRLQATRLQLLDIYG